MAENQDKKPWEDVIPKVGPAADRDGGDSFDREFIGKFNEHLDKFSRTDFEDMKGVLEDVVSSGEDTPDEENNKPDRT